MKRVHRFSKTIRICLFAFLLGGWMTSSLITGCSGRKEVPPGRVLAEIGDKVVTVDDLRYRAELTVRLARIETPAAVLNNLIAEKLLSIEAGDTSRLARSERFQAYVRGIREQAMREALYQELAVKPVQIDTAEIMRTYRLSQRVYYVEFLTINNPDIQARIDARLTADPDARPEVFDELKELGETGFQTVKWRDPEADPIHLALFSRPLGAGEVIGPVRLDGYQSIMMRVADARIQPVIGPEDQRMRIDQVRAKLTDLKARATWNAYKAGLMRGKSIQFEKEVFNQIVEWFMAAHAEREAHRYQDRGEDNPIDLKSPEQLEALRDQPFFRENGKVWTVEDFRRAVMSRPLVYRQTPGRHEPFPERFKRAVGDLVVDRYLNEAAYGRGLDKLPEVRHEGRLWSDALLARHHLEQHLKKMDLETLQQQDPAYLGMRAVDEYLVRLRDKYEKKIRIDYDALEEIELTRVPLAALRHEMPYPMAVPGFPQYTTADTLIFGGGRAP
ncbi:MAG TPA: hypothetical protein ENN17_01845 [bacterium]|nr:hypothetical protein [bacterium]